jgi:hypothetical protein
LPRIGSAGTKKMPGRAGGNDMTPEEKQKEKGIF